MRWLLCKLLGHRWIDIAVNHRKFVNLFHLYPKAGHKQECTRCGRVWDDTFGFGGDFVTLIPQPLPRATATKGKP